MGDGIVRSGWYHCPDDAGGGRAREQQGRGTSGGCLPGPSPARGAGHETQGVGIAGAAPTEGVRVPPKQSGAKTRRGFRSGRALAALGLAAFIPACAASATSSPSKSTAASLTIAIATLPGKILFTRAGGIYGDETVFTANSNGTNQKRVTPFGTQCCPRWSPDGTHISISASAPDGTRITTGIISADGSRERMLPLPDATLSLAGDAWSQDGNRIEFEGWDDAMPRRNGIYTAQAADGGKLVRVTHNPDQGSHDRAMDISPDGSKIFFFRPVNGFPSLGNDLEGSLFVVNADGTDLQRVTPQDMPVEVVGNAGGRLSRDGKWIAFTSAGVIWTIHPDGSNLTKVFQDPLGRLAITPTWSPDGRYILFGLDPPGSLAVVEAAPANGLYVIRADGTGLTPLLVSNDWKREPDWVAPQ